MEKRRFLADRSISAKSGYSVSWGADHRDGHCQECGSKLLQDPTVPEEVKVKRNYCSTCRDYKKGVLISRGVSVRPPNPPACLSPICLSRYFKDAFFVALLASYHSRRVAYAEAKRHANILERYRTGEPAPKTIWEAIHANTKLKCPICRRYNVDPFLHFGWKEIAILASLVIAALITGALLIFT